MDETEHEAYMELSRLMGEKSIAHRRAHPLPSTPVEHRLAERAARHEANALLADHHGKPRAIMLAAMLATEGRETTGPELSATKLEDSLHAGPGPESRMGALAIAASLLSTRTSRPKGPTVRDATMDLPGRPERGR